MECIPSKRYICEKCNKEYSTRQNLWKHNAKFHTNNVNIQDTIVIQPNEIVNQPKIVVIQEEKIDENNKLICKTLCLLYSGAKQFIVLVFRYKSMRYNDFIMLINRGLAL